MGEVSFVDREWKIFAEALEAGWRLEVPGAVRHVTLGMDG
jgi:hypothetical protein